MEEKTNRSWQDLMQELFEKLGMHDCGFGVQPESSRSSIENPWPHETSSTEPVPVIPDALHGDNPAALWPAVGIHCNMSSYGDFLQFHLDGYYGRPTPLLQRNGFEMLHTSWPGLQRRYTYGGWFHNLTSVNGSEYYTPESNTLNYAWGWLLVEQDEAFMSMTNVGGDQGFNASSAALYFSSGYTVAPVDT